MFMSLPSLQISLYLIANDCMKRRLIYRPESRHEYWRYFTYMLLHADEWHLTINMCLQVRMSTPRHLLVHLPVDACLFCSALSVSRWNWSRVIAVWAWSTLWEAFAVHWPMPGCSRSCCWWAPRRASMPCCAVMCRTWFWSVNCGRLIDCNRNFKFPICFYFPLSELFTIVASFCAHCCDTHPLSLRCGLHNISFLRQSQSQSPHQSWGTFWGNCWRIIVRFLGLSATANDDDDVSRKKTKSLVLLELSLYRI